MFSLKTIFLLTAWIGILIAAAVAIVRGQDIIPSFITPPLWLVYFAYCSVAAVIALAPRSRSRGYYTGFAIFGLMSAVATLVTSSDFETTIGYIIYYACTETFGMFDVPDVHGAMQRSLIRLFDLAACSSFAFAGGIVGHFAWGVVDTESH